MSDINYGEILEALNDKVDLSGSWSAPSENRIALTPGAHGASYTMPDDGYLNVRAYTSAAGQYIYVGDDTYNKVAWQTSGATVGEWAVNTLPVRKGQTLIINYNMTDLAINFIYAQKTN